MAGDWIKMRMDLQTHPKVFRMASALKADKFRVVGALHAVWSVFDAHSEDGILGGYTLESMDFVIGWKGFSKAMSGAGVEWLRVVADGLEMPRFDEHNGESAKKRAMDKERKRIEREKPSADIPPNVQDLSENEADKKETREREEREKKVNQDSVEREERGEIAPTLAGAICARLKKSGITAVNPSHPKLLALIQAGATADEIGAIADEPKAKKSFPWVLATAIGRRNDAAEAGAIPQARASPRRPTLTETRAAVNSALTTIGPRDPQEQRNERDITGESNIVAIGAS